MPMNNAKRPSTPLSQAAQKLAKSERHDAEFFAERKKRDAANLEKNLKLRNMRLAKEAEDRVTAAAEKASKPAPARKAKPKAESK